VFPPVIFSLENLAANIPNILTQFFFLSNLINFALCTLNFLNLNL
jgi:hypothetical protein